MKLSVRESRAKRLELYNWLAQPLSIREPKRMKHLAVILGLSAVTLSHWKRDYEAEKKQGTLCVDYNSVDWLNNRSRDADESLMRAVERGSPAAIKLYYQITGKYIEKAEYEHKFSISADELIKRVIEANRKARDMDDGRNPEVHDQPTLLSDGIRQDSGQSQQEDSQMAAVAVSS